jgi:tetratricopeptide (TPR) repeat protein
MPALSPRLVGFALALLTWGGAQAQAPAAPASDDAPTHSALDAPLFYQLLIGELELRGGEPGSAFQVLLDAARRTQDESLFRRSVEIALQSRAGEQALLATRAWHDAAPDSLDALRTQVQLATALNRFDDIEAPLGALLRQTPAAERPGVIASLPRFFQRAIDRRRVAVLLESVLAPWLAQPETRAPARVAMGRAWLAAGDTARALALAEQAQDADAAGPGPVLLALEMLPGTAAAERLVIRYLDQPAAEPAVRLAYVRVLIQAQRYAAAMPQLEVLTKARPELPQPWLTLGALRLEMHQVAEAEAALERYLALHAAQSIPGGAKDGEESSPVQAWLLLAEAAEKRGDLKAMESWLARIDSGEQALDIQVRRAALVARRGDVDAALELVRRTPELKPEDARAKLLAEAQVLRQIKRWSEAHTLLTQASQRHPTDTDLLYELAMMADKMGRLDEMEQVLRRVIELKPEHHHAYNALGYSLADRHQRLPEARTLIARALQLAPGDPFITDSLGWVEFRLGNQAEALRLLRHAYAIRPDVEIAAHLGEVLWMSGERDEARRVWREARNRDAANEVLHETLTRLQVEL